MAHPRNFSGTFGTPYLSLHTAEVCLGNHGRKRNQRCRSHSAVLEGICPHWNTRNPCCEFAVKRHDWGRAGRGSPQTALAFADPPSLPFLQQQKPELGRAEEPWGYPGSPESRCPEASGAAPWMWAEPWGHVREQPQRHPQHG